MNENNIKEKSTMQRLLPENIKATWQHNDTLLVLYQIPIFHLERITIGYRLYQSSEIIFEGVDYSPSPLHRPFSLNSAIGLLGFLTTMPQDTDTEFFKDYTDTQYAWLRTYAEELACELSDYEDPNSEHHADTVRIFSSQYQEL